MSTTILASEPRSLKTTDGVRVGFEKGGRARRRDAMLAELTADVSVAVGEAYWSFMLYGELEDAFDTAFLREAIAETPTLSGSRMVWAF